MKNRNCNFSCVRLNKVFWLFSKLNRRRSVLRDGERECMEVEDATIRKKHIHIQLRNKINKFIGVLSQ